MQIYCQRLCPDSPHPARYWTTSSVQCSAGESVYIHHKGLFSFFGQFIFPFKKCSGSVSWLAQTIQRGQYLDNCAVNRFCDLGFLEVSLLFNSSNWTKTLICLKIRVLPFYLIFCPFFLKLVLMSNLLLTPSFFSLVLTWFIFLKKQRETGS